MNGHLVFSGQGNPILSEKVRKKLGFSGGKLHLGNFADGEIGVWIEDDVWGEHTIVIAPTCSPVNDRLMELSLIIDTLRRGGARSIMAVIPYFGYARQDRQTRTRGSEPISAKVAARLIETVGATSIFSIDIHSTTETGFLKIPFINILSTPIFTAQLKKEDLANAVIVSPDEGGVERARDLAAPFYLPLAFLVKAHAYDTFNQQNQVKIVDFTGDVEGKTAIIYDDVASSGQTLFKNAKKLKEKGAVKILACITHCAFTPEAFTELETSAVDKVYITDTIPTSGKSKKIEVLSVSDLLAQEIAKRVS